MSDRAERLRSLRTALYERVPPPGVMVAEDVTPERVRALLADSPELYAEIVAAWDAGWNLYDWIGAQLKSTTPLPADDLIVRAATLLQNATSTSLGADISIDKRLPAQAGMGGGSSDAASTLLALNRLWNLQLPLSRLEQMGLQLGADVPFFLRGHNAWVEGIGEQITPAALPPARFCVLKPAAGVDTASIFRHPQLERATKPATIADFAADPYGFGHNDLQPVAQALCPEVSQALALLESQGLQARMTGSGSAVFAHLATPGHAAIQAPDHWVVRECGNLEVHPLQGWAASDN
mgnify:CR=1 FL=1